MSIPMLSRQLYATREPVMDNHDQSQHCVNHLQSQKLTEVRVKCLSKKKMSEVKRIEGLEMKVSLQYNIIDTRRG